MLLRMFVCGAVVLGVGATPCALQAQNVRSSCISPGFSGGGPIVLGTIARTNLTPQKGLPTVSIAVTQYLRGPKFDGDSVDVPVDWTADSTAGFVGRAPVWYGVAPQIGKHVLIMLWRPSGTLAPLCVLDMGSSDTQAAAKTVEKMVRLDETPRDQKIQAMESALADPEIAVRNMAVNYLTSPSIRDPQVRLVVFQHFAGIVADSHNTHRVEALDFLERAYDSFSTTSDVNYQILSFLADQMADPDPVIRSVSVQRLHSKFFGGGTNKPDINRIHITDRAKTIQRLQQDVAEHQEHADQAQRMLNLLSTNK